MCPSPSRRAIPQFPGNRVHEYEALPLVARDVSTWNPSPFHTRKSIREPEDVLVVGRRLEILDEDVDMTAPQGSHVPP